MNRCNFVFVIFKVTADLSHEFYETQPRNIPKKNTIVTNWFP